MRIIHRRRSIYTQLLWLLIISALAAGILFYILHIYGQSMINYYLYDTDYVENQNQKYAEKLQDFIDENDLSSKDTVSLRKWVENQKILNVQIYKDNIQTFDSSYPDQEIWEAEIVAGSYDWISYRPLTFSDGNAEIVISGIYEYRLNNYALIIEIGISFLFFVILVLFGIRRKMKYITRLSHEIEILEGGQLDYAITVRGSDELSLLAQGLDDMRLSFKKLIRNESDMVQENQRIVTEMSHDIRTPITSIMLYIEILKKGKYKDEEQLKNYIDKLEQKAQRLKQLTDHLFEYSLTSGEKEIELEEPEDASIIFFDLFSETCNYLDHQGFKVDFEAEFPDRKLRISSDYLMRIMDNITSNIIKYADPACPIRILSPSKRQSPSEKAGAFSTLNPSNGQIRFKGSASDMLCLVFENKIRPLNDRVESTGIGLKNVENMMCKMNGSCESEIDGNIFRLYLKFPFC